MAICVNYALINQILPIFLRNVNTTPVHMKDNPIHKTNFQPVTVWSLVLNVFEQVIYNQLGKYKETFPNKLFCGIRKTQYNLHSLLTLWRIWRTDLSKAHDCLRQYLIITRFEAYGLSKSSLSFLLAYLTSRKQRVKIGWSYSVWSEIKRGVPRGSILGLLLFNVFIHDIFMFIEKTDVSNFADDNTIYDCGKDLSNILEKLNHDLKMLLK